MRVIKQKDKAKDKKAEKGILLTWPEQIAKWNKVRHGNRRR